MSKSQANTEKKESPLLTSIASLIEIARECKKTYDEIIKVLREFGLISYTPSYTSLDKFIQIFIQTQYKQKPKSPIIDPEVKRELELCSNTLQQLQYIYSSIKGEGLEDILRLFSSKEEEQLKIRSEEDEARLKAVIEKFKKKKRRVNLPQTSEPNYA